MLALKPRSGMSWWWGWRDGVRVWCVAVLLVVVVGGCSDGDEVSSDDEPVDESSKVEEPTGGGLEKTTDDGSERAATPTTIEHSEGSGDSEGSQNMEGSENSEGSEESGDMEGSGGLSDGLVGSDVGVGGAQFVVSGVAPDWPFDGMINLYTSVEIVSGEPEGKSELQYRSAVDGRVTVVQVPVYLPACAENSYISVNEYETVVVLRREPAGGNDFVVMRVPWGDGVYPFFAVPGFAAPGFVDWPYGTADGWQQDGYRHETVFDGFSVSGGMVNYDWLELSAGGEIRYYPVYIEYSGPPEGHDSPESYVPPSVQDELNKYSPDEQHFYNPPSTRMLGTDGRFYGFASASFEPLCDLWEVFILAADTGEVLGCGATMVAPVLGRAQGKPGSVEEFVFPGYDIGANYDKKCDSRASMDLKQFSLPSQTHQPQTTTNATSEPQQDATAPPVTEPITPTTTTNATSEPQQDATAPPVTEPITPTTTTTAAATELRVEHATFGDGPAPQWPFRGLVQLWPSQRSYTGGRSEPSWVLRYWNWDVSSETYSQVVLPDLWVDCLSRVALVVHPERGIEVGGPSDAVSSTYWVPWGGLAQRMDAPSQELLQAQKSRPSNVTVSSEGDVIHIGTDSQTRSYAIHDPTISDDVRWDVQARHDGELFLITVHPAHLSCYSGVTWISVAATGEHVICGANSAATTFVNPSASASQLVLPDPGAFPVYLSCTPQLNLEFMRFTEAPRTLVSSYSCSGSPVSAFVC